MTRRRAIKGVLRNFLDTYTSRYSEYNGYWLFGFVIYNLERVSIDLLSSDDEPISPVWMTIAFRLARQKFVEQIEKVGFNLSYFREAQLEITKSPILRTEVLESGHRRRGYDVTFAVRAVSDQDKTYESEISVFVAPHDPGAELQSVRPTDARLQSTQRWVCLKEQVMQLGIKLYGWFQRK